MELVKQKLIAFLIHLAISALFVLPFLSIVYFILYTPSILELEGGDRIALIVLGVDLFIGPFLTLIIYRRHKPGLALDLTVIGLIQVTALSYGAYILISERPLYLAYIVEHFEVISAPQINLEDLTDKTLAPALLQSPQLVYVQRPTGPRKSVILMDALQGGKDVHHYPEYYRQYDSHIDVVRAKGWSLSKLQAEHPDKAGQIQAHLKQLNKDQSEVFFSPVSGSSGNVTAILDISNGHILDYVDVSIW